MDDNKKKCVIVVPTHKEFCDLHYSEVASLEQLYRIFGEKYDIKILTKRSVDIQPYKCVFNGCKNVSDVCVENIWLNSWRGYTNLVSSERFYAMFSEYEYILIYQLDAWVFRDELEYWCDQNYDYIGAPFWFEPSKDFIIGNGGVSLRRVQAMINYINNNNDENLDRYGFDDTFFSVNYSNTLTIPEKLIGAKFALDECADVFCGQMKQLPFCAHKFLRNETCLFWKNKIDLSIAESAYKKVINYYKNKCDKQNKE